MADYSLRRFLLHALNPLHWPNLVALWRQAKLERQEFALALAPWLEGEPRAGVQVRHVFRPWLRQPPLSGEPPILGAADPHSPDPELRMRVDRLGWVLERELRDGAVVWGTLARWSAQRWEKDLAHSDSYSISERLANLILLWNLHEPPPALAATLLRLMLADAKRLLAKPEYHGAAGTNNHILNNARALILCGSFLDSDLLYRAGCWLLESQLAYHVSAEGVVREASSHYQWVVTRWLVEVACVFRSRDAGRFAQLRPQLAAMLVACDAMLLGSPSRSYLPLVGDISPDFPPEFYGGLTDFGRALFAIVDDAEESAAAAADGFWATRFKGRCSNAGVDWLASDCSWARLVRGPWALLTHAETHPVENRATHGHHDLFSFELAWQGVPLVIDPGRRNYLAGRDTEDAGILEEWHNTLQVAGQRTGFIARSYMPTGWLTSFRRCPELAFDAAGLAVVLDRPMPGVAVIRRRFGLTSAGAFCIVSEVETTNAARRLPVRLVLYLPGEVALAADQLQLAVEGERFLLSWRGLLPPQRRPATRYIAYDRAVPCTRLEWHAEAMGVKWVATIEIARIG